MEFLQQKNENILFCWLHRFFNCCWWYIQKTISPTYIIYVYDLCLDPEWWFHRCLFIFGFYLCCCCCCQVRGQYIFFYDKWIDLLSKIWKICFFYNLPFLFFEQKWSIMLNVFLSIIISLIILIGNNLNNKSLSW